MEPSQRVYRHDLQNHFVCLSGLLECGNVEQARSYLRELQAALPVSETKQYSQRIVLNCLLNQKAALAEAKQFGFILLVKMIISFLLHHLPFSILL